MNQVVEFELMPDDYRRFNLYHQAHSPTLRRTYWIAMLLPQIFLLCACAYLVWQRPPWQTAVERLSNIWPVLVLVPLFAVFLPRIHRYRMNKQLASMISEGKNRGILGYRRVELSSDGVLSSGQFTHSLTSWQAVERIAEDAEYLFIYLSAVSAIPIPRRAFANPLKYDEFAVTARDFYGMHHGS